MFREGAEEGEKRGEKRGQVLGRLALVTQRLRRRIGEPTADQQARIERLSADELGALGEALLDFTGNEDLERWLAGARG